MIKFFFIITAFFSFKANALEDEALFVKNVNYQINSIYKSGSFLIYNCENEYYACVDEDSFKLCSDKRKDSIGKKEKFYPCAPIYKYPNKIKCAEKNYEVIESLAKKRFCYPKIQ
jgi:sorbitol-specific phosphotransferase system component IIBC